MTRYKQTMKEALAKVRKEEPANPDEMEMAYTQLEFIEYAVNEVEEYIKSGVDFPEWLQNKLTKAHEVMKDIHAYMEGERSKEAEYGEQKESVELTEASAGADARRAMRNDPDMVQRFSKDVKATDADKAATAKNMIVQLRKSSDVKGNLPIEFADGKKQKVDAKVVDTLLKAHDKIQKPADKEQFVAMISKSYRDMLNVTKVVAKQLKMGEEVSFGEETLEESVELEEGKSSTGYELYHKDFSSAMAHAYDFAKKKFGIEVDPKEIDDKVASGPRKPSKGKTNSYRLLGKDGKKAIQVQVYGMDNGKYELNMYKEETMKEAALMIAEKLKVSDGLGAWIDDFVKSDAPQFQGKDKEERKNMAIAAFTDAGGKLESVEESASSKFLSKQIGNMQTRNNFATGKSRIPTPAERRAEMERLKKKEETVNEMREPYAVVDTADGNKVVGTASSEMGAKSIITSAELPPMKIKDKKTLKIVKVKKKQMIGYPIKEEEEPKNDQAKQVDQSREDKKKTRIAQLQLQIAKAQEMINRLNRQTELDKMNKGENYA